MVDWQGRRRLGMWRTYMALSWGRGVGRKEGRQVKCSPQGLREVGDVSKVREHQERGLGMWGSMDQSWGERRGQTWAGLRRKT